MTIEEVKKVIEESGLSEEQACVMFLTMYQQDKIDFEELKALINMMGKGLSKEFVEMSEEERKKIDFLEEEEEEEDKEDEKEKAMKLFGIKEKE